VRQRRSPSSSAAGSSGCGFQGASSPLPPGMPGRSGWPACLARSRQIRDVPRPRRAHAFEAQ
jgi:hypothetical protein